MEYLTELFAAKYQLRKAIKLIREATELESTTEMYQRQKQFLNEVKSYEPS
jgi:hypothetical protein